jgi:hypothetical protein
LDRAGLVALWREGLLAQKVLRGKTVGYRFHPQLDRFRECRNPVAAIGVYLSAIHKEACARGYSFDASKIVSTRRHPHIAVTKGQVDYEIQHLSKKLRKRAADLLPQLEIGKAKLHPLFRLVPGEIEPWEVRSPTDTRRSRAVGLILRGRADHRRTKSQSRRVDAENNAPGSPTTNRKGLGNGLASPKMPEAPGE